MAGAGDMKLSFVIEAVDMVSTVGNKILNATQGAASGVARAWQQAGGGMQRFGSSYAGIAAMVGGGLEVREIMRAQDFWTRLAAQYGLAAGEADKLHKTLLEVAAAAKIPMSDMQETLEGYRDAGGAVAAYGEHAATAAAAVQLLGGQGDAVGRMMAALRERFHIEGAEEMRRTIAAINEQTRNAPGGFAQAAQSVNALAAGYAALGHAGPAAARELGAAYAVIASGAKSGRQAYGELEQLLALLSTLHGRMELEAIGVKVAASPDDLVKGATLPMTEILANLAQAYKVNPTVVTDRLGPQLAKDLSVIIADVQRTGKPITLDAKMAVAGDPAKFMRDAADAGKSLQGSLNQLRTSLDAIGDTYFDGPLRSLAGVISSMPGLIAFLIASLAGLAFLGTVGRWAWQGAQMLGVFGRMLLWIGGGLVGGAVSALGWLAAGFETLAGWTAFSPALSAFFAMIARGIFSVGLAIEATPIGWFLTAVAAIAGTAYLIYENWGEVKAWFATLWGGVIAVFEGVVDFVAGVFTGNFSRAWDGIKRATQGAVDVVGSLMEAFISPFRMAARWIDGVFGTSIVESVAAAAGAYKRAVHGLADTALPAAPVPAPPGVAAPPPPESAMPKLPAGIPAAALYGVPLMVPLPEIPTPVAPSLSPTRGRAAERIDEGLEGGDAAERRRAFGGALEGGETTHKVGGEISVKFENAPKGLRASVKREAGVELDLSMGYAMVAP